MDVIDGFARGATRSRPPWLTTPAGSSRSREMRILHDFQGLAIRLTDERLAHILEHPEMVGMQSAIEQTLVHPERVVESIADPQAHLYYRYYVGTRVGDKYLCVVVKVGEADAFVLTAYLTDRIRHGVTLWPREG